MRKILAPLLLGISGFIVLASLGIWQLQRLEWKQNLIAQREADLQQPGVPLADYLASPQNANTVFFAITDQGEYQDGFTDILAGAAGRAGYRRIVTAEIDGQQVMIEAGFLPEDAKSEPYTLPSGIVPIDGHVFNSQGRIGTFDAARNVWVGYDIDAMAAQLGTEPILIVARTSPVAAWSDTPAAVDLPNSHLGYAIQWFGLALVWALMAFYWGYTRAKKGKS